MLRNVLIGLGLAAFLGGLVTIFTGFFPPSLVCAVWGALLVLALVFERFRYKPVETARPGAGWVRTDERFVDNETGKPVTVYIEPRSGERKYVQE